MWSRGYALQPTLVSVSACFGTSSDGKSRARSCIKCSSCPAEDQAAAALKAHDRIDAKTEPRGVARGDLAVLVLMWSISLPDWFSTSPFLLEVSGLIRAAAINKCA